jgi:hypothetical protein
MASKVGYNAKELRGLLVDWAGVGFEAKATTAGAMAAILTEGGVMTEAEHRIGERAWVFSISREAAGRLRHRATRLARLALDEGEEAATEIVMGHKEQTDEVRHWRHHIVIKVPKEDSAAYYARRLRDDINARNVVEYQWEDKNVEKLLAEGVEISVWDLSRLEAALPNWSWEGFELVG